MAVVLIAAALAPAASPAGHCNNQLVIFSGRREVWPWWFNTAAVTCQNGLHTYGIPQDTRIINPGSDALSVAFYPNGRSPFCEPDRDQMHGWLNGLGHVNEPITLTCRRFVLGRYMLTEPIPIAGSTAASGCVSASILDQFQREVSVSFHTVDASCPDFP